MSKLLLVEDDAEVSSFLKYVLEQEEFQVDLARSVGEARAALQGQPADLVVIDRGLPDGDGLELCREIRGRRDLAGLPVMVLTARKSPADIEDAFAAGGNDFLPKPFSFVDLVARLQALLQPGAAA